MSIDISFTTQLYPFTNIFCVSRQSLKRDLLRLLCKLPYSGSVLQGRLQEFRKNKDLWNCPCPISLLLSSLLIRFLFLFFQIARQRWDVTEEIDAVTRLDV